MSSPALCGPRLKMCHKSEVYHAIHGGTPGLGIAGRKVHSKWGRLVTAKINSTSSAKTAGKMFKSGVVKTGLAAVLLLSTSAVALHADDASVQQELAQLKAQIAALKAAVREQKAETNKTKEKIKVVADRSVPPAQPGNSALQGAQWSAADFARHVVNPSDDAPLTFYGITLYGTVDTGFGYESHGAPLSSTLGQGVGEVIQKANYKSLFSLVPNGLSQSNVGIKGSIPVASGFSAVFDLETRFVPTSGQLMNGPASIAQQNGRVVNNGGEASNSDSSKAGQAFTFAYGGVAHPVYGTLTFGRQNSLAADSVGAYDPTGGSYAFSLLGWSGTLNSGFGSTQDAPADASIKYRDSFGPFRVGALYKFDNQGNGSSGAAYEGEVGFDYAGFSLDGIFGKAENAISASQLSAAEVTTANAGTLGTTFGNAGVTLANAQNGLLDATLSDNTAFTVQGKYVNGPFKFYAGYENIHYSNPSNPYATGTPFYMTGNYGVYTLTQDAYDTGKIVQLLWAGAKYSVRPDLDVTVAYYHEIQNSYIAGKPGTAATTGLCYNSSLHGNCSGTEDAVSLLGVYHWTKRFDVYGGVMYSVVNGGLASGFASTGGLSATGGATANSSNSAGSIAPTVGARLQF